MENIHFIKRGRLKSDFLDSPLYDEYGVATKSFKKIIIRNEAVENFFDSPYGYHLFFLINNMVTIPPITIIEPMINTTLTQGSMIAPPIS